MINQNQVVHDPTDDSGAKGLGMETSAAASSTSTSTMTRPATSTPVPSRKPLEDNSTASRSRKGKERAQDSEEATTEVANIAKKQVDTKLRVQYDSSYASQLALNEARQSGLSQERLEAMTKSCDPSSAAAECDGDENPVGSSANVMGPEQASSWALTKSQPLTNVGRRSIGDAQSSPPSREASPARTETDSNITYDDGPQDDGQDIGGPTAGVSDVALSNIGFCRL